MVWEIILAHIGVSSEFLATLYSQFMDKYHCIMIVGILPFH